MRAEEARPWTDEMRTAILADPVLSQLGTDGLDALLDHEERAAVQEWLDILARNRRRVEAESRGLVLP
jgi:hypothetical protein